MARIHWQEDEIDEEIEIPDEDLEGLHGARREIAIDQWLDAERQSRGGRSFTELTPEVVAENPSVTGE